MKHILVNFRNIFLLDFQKKKKKKEKRLENQRHSAGEVVSSFGAEA